MILEIKGPSRYYGWVWRQAAQSTNKKELVDYAETLPLNHYFQNKRTYRIVGVPHG